MKGKPAASDFWAKLAYDDAGAVAEWHPLAAHCADVAAVTEALLRRTVLRRRLAQLAGWDDLSSVHVARLAALAALHDAGKVNHSFQDQASDARARSRGHVGPMVELMTVDDPQKWLGPLGITGLLRWFPSDEELWHFLLATWGHHGRPVVPEGVPRLHLWKPNARRDPLAGLRRLSERVRAWFPEAFEEAAAPFPAGPPLQHAFNGLLTLADWIGSHRRFFDFAEDEGDPMPRARQNAAQAVERLFLDASAARRQLGAEPVGFGGVLEDARWRPRPIQQACLDLPLYAEGSLTVLESDTGSGKTEAALARFLKLYQAGLVDGMYFAVPTRSAATQLHARVGATVGRVFPAKEQRPPVVQAVPGYIKADDAEGVPLPAFEVRWPDDPRDLQRERRWAAEHPKRYLAGAVVVGTVDQVLLSARACGSTRRVCPTARTARPAPAATPASGLTRKSASKSLGRCTASASARRFRRISATSTRCAAWRARA